MKTLVIVDCQPKFMSGQEYTSEFDFFVDTEIVPLVLEAKSNNEEIVIVEFAGYGETHQLIMNQIKDYDKTHFVKKETPAGGYNIFDMFKKKRLSTQKFLVCGIYADQCVRATSETLKTYFPSCEVMVEKKATMPSVFINIFKEYEIDNILHSIDPYKKNFTNQK